MNLFIIVCCDNQRKICNSMHFCDCFQSYKLYIVYCFWNYWNDLTSTTRIYIYKRQNRLKWFIVFVNEILQTCCYFLVVSKVNFRCAHLFISTMSDFTAGIHPAKMSNLHHSIRFTNV